MKKLSFNELAISQVVLSLDEQLQILGGNGGVTGGTGTTSDPFVITANYYTVGNIEGASDAAGQFNGQTVTVNGKTYTYSVNVIQKADLASAQAARDADPTGYGNIIKSGDLNSTNSGREVWGDSSDDEITIDTSHVNNAFSGANANRSGYNGPSGISQAEFSANLIGHEMLHTLGVEGHEGGGAMQQVTPIVNSSTGKIVGYNSNSVNTGNLEEAAGGM